MNTKMYYHCPGNMSSISCRHSEAKASECLQDIEDMFPQYYMHSDIHKRYLTTTTLYCVICFESVKVDDSKYCSIVFDDNTYVTGNMSS